MDEFTIVFIRPDCNQMNYQNECFAVGTVSNSDATYLYPIKVV